MFKVEKHNELVKATPQDKGIWVERTSLVRDDGFCLKGIGSGREGDHHFLYTDRDVSFEFRAMRYDVYHKPVDTWDVWLGTALRHYSPSNDGPVSVEKAREIAANIKEALMAWPPLRPPAPAIQHVKVQMRFWPVWNPAWEDTL